MSVNSKVEIRVMISEAEWIPEAVRRTFVEQNASRINKRGEFVVSSDRSRAQPENYADCISKIYDAIREAAHVPEGPSEKTIERVKELQLLDKERKMKAKQFRSAAKTERRKSSSWD
eukprot:jgi/Hompol1/2895/HPOL_003066-RA